MKIKHISALFFLAGATAFGQIKTNQISTLDPKSNAFLDASENTDGQPASIGRGLLFPQTDLSTFKLDLASADGINYPTFFDGMLVFNTKEGGSTTDTNIQTTDNLERGFYYFSNPEGVNNQGIAEGQWVKLCGCSTSGTGGGTTPGNGSPIVLPPEIVIGSGERMIASVYDTDYLPYTAPTAPATWDASASDGTADTTVDVQGVIPTTGVTVQIPITVVGSNDVTLPAYTSADLVIPAEKTQDNTSRTLVLSWAPQVVNSTTKSFTATIKSKGGDLNIKKLDINSGIGNDAKGVFLGEFTYPSASDNSTAKYAVRAIAGIPDKKFGQQGHNHLYLPVTDSQGRIWLNHNVGADYADITSPDFNLTINPQVSDPKAWGNVDPRDVGVCPEGFRSLTKDDLDDRVTIINHPSGDVNMNLPGRNEGDYSDSYGNTYAWHYDFYGYYYSAGWDYYTIPEGHIWFRLKKSTNTSVVKEYSPEQDDDESGSAFVPIYGNRCIKD